MAELLPGVMSPEELEEEIRGWERRRYKQQRRLVPTPPSPDFRKPPSK
jgi:hypothetical protein